VKIQEQKTVETRCQREGGSNRGKIRKRLEVGELKNEIDVGRKCFSGEITLT